MDSQVLQKVRGLCPTQTLGIGSAQVGQVVTR